MARLERRSEISAARFVRARVATDPPARRPRSREARLAAGKGYGGDRAAARAHDDPRRQRRICARKSFLRSDDAARQPRPLLQREAQVRVPWKKWDREPGGVARSAASAGRQTLPRYSRPNFVSILRR